MNPLQTGMFPQSQMDKTQFATPTQMPVSREIVSSDFDTQVNPYTGDLPRFDRGGHVGLKSIAGDLAQYGRNGDTMVAHINPQEAAMLKAMGGSGTINPVTGLREFGMFGIGGGGGILGTGINKGGSDPISNALSNNPISQGVSKGFQSTAGMIDQGLVGLDKAVGKTIPGGWGTLGMAAASFIPGMTPMMMAGLGALNGSGVLRKGGSFNLQGALMGGAMAYGMSNLAQGLEAAGGAPAPDVPVSSVPTPTATPTPVGDFAGSLSDPTAGMAQAYTPPPPPGITSNLMSGNIGTAVNQAGEAISSGAGRAYDSLANFADKATTGSTYSDLAKGYGENVSNAGKGIANLTGMGDGTSAAAQKAFEASGAKLTNTALPIVMGGMGLSDLEAQRNYAKDMQSSNNAANAEWNNIMAGVEQRRKRSEDAVRAHPYQFSSGGSMPRFLSGGGDGLSDDIPATIEGKQPARLADGEFVVSADVVSGLGGGSSKAGAKKLYSMMDRIRKQAYGTEKQVRKVSNRALPA